MGTSPEIACSADPLTMEPVTNGMPAPITDIGEVYSASSVTNDAPHWEDAFIERLHARASRRGVLAAGVAFLGGLAVVHAGCGTRVNLPKSVFNPDSTQTPPHPLFHPKSGLPVLSDTRFLIEVDAAPKEVRDALTKHLATSQELATTYFDKRFLPLVPLTLDSGKPGSPVFEKVFPEADTTNFRMRADWQVTQPSPVQGTVASQEFRILSTFKDYYPVSDQFITHIQFPQFVDANNTPVTDPAGNVIIPTDKFADYIRNSKQFHLPKAQWNITTEMRNYPKKGKYPIEHIHIQTIDKKGRSISLDIASDGMVNMMVLYP